MLKRGVDLPALKPAVDPTLPANRKQMEQWLATDGTGDVARRIKAVYALLKGWNQAPLDDNNRFVLLEQIKPAVAEIVSGLDRHYAGLDQPLPLPNRKIALSLGKLLFEYGLGYQRLAHALVDSTSRFDRSGITAMAHYRVMELACQRMMVFFRAYLSLPTGLWRDAHTIYLRSRELEIESQSFDGQQTISQLYLAMVLLELADPYRLIAGGIDQVHDYVLQNLRLCTIGSGVGAERKTGHFVVHFGIDAGASEVGDLVLRKDEDGILVDTSQLVKTIHQQLTDLAQVTPAEDQRYQQKQRVVMLRCLVVAFALRPNRQQDRRSERRKVWVVRGVKPVHHCLASGEVVDRVTELHLGDTGTPVEVSGQSSPGLALQPDHWEILDVSVGGLALLRDSSGRSRIMIGDLLGVADDAHGPWQTFMVRRVRYVDEEDMVVGVQKLEGKVSALKVVGGEPGERSPALLYQPAGDDKDSLLLPPGNWHSGDKIVTDQAPAQTVVLGRVLELTRQFELYELSD